MADEGAEAQQSGGKSRKGMIIVVSGILLVEAVVIIGVMKLFGGPPDVSAMPPDAVLEPAEDEKIVEIQVLKSRLPNKKTGITYLYDTEIYVQVKKKFEPRVLTELEQFQNEIKAEISAIWRSSEPHHFEEPKHQNLTRKVEGMLRDRLGIDPISGEQIVNRCIIVINASMRVDS